MAQIVEIVREDDMRKIRVISSEVYTDEHDMPVAIPLIATAMSCSAPRKGSTRRSESANVPLRGVNATAAANLRQGFEIVEGRMFTPGTFEIVVGRGAASQFAGLEALAAAY